METLAAERRRGPATSEQSARFKRMLPLSIVLRTRMASGPEPRSNATRAQSIGSILILHTWRQIHEYRTEPTLFERLDQKGIRMTSMESGIRIEARIPSPEDYNWLRREAEWPEMDGDACIRCLPESQYVVSAFDGGELVGMGRIVGDGGLCFYIQDVIVAKSHRRRGVGTAVMEALMDFIAERAVKDTYVGLMSAVGKEPFYGRFGFTSRPTETLGCGMTLMWPVVAPGGEGSDGLRSA